MKRWHAFLQLLIARLREFYREPQVLFWVYGFPLLLALGLGVGFSSGDPEPPPVDLVSDSGLPAGLADFLREQGLKVEEHPRDVCQNRLRIGKSAAYVEAQDSAFACVHDVTRADSKMAFHHVDAALQRWKHRTNAQDVHPIPVTERGSRYIDFLIPGLMGINLLSGGLFGVGYAIVDLRVRKLLKRLLATPMHRGDFLVSLVVSRTMLVLPEMLVLLVFATLAFKVPIRGNYFTLGLVLLVSALTFDGFGLLIGARTEKAESVGGLINLLMLPQWLLSGTFFSSKRYPDWMQPFIQALPLTQVNDALREVMLEGATLAQVAWRIAILAFYGLASYFIALRYFRWN